MKSKQILYLAYGSNLLRKQMAARCPDCIYVGLARLEGWKFQYDGASLSWSNMAVGNIIQSPNDEVWGAIYKLSLSDLNKLDGFEHYPVNYTRRPVSVTMLPQGIKAEVFAYTRTGRGVNLPSKQYANAILSGARQNKLPDKYISVYLAVQSTRY